MNARIPSPSDGTTGTAETVAVTGDYGTSFVRWLTAGVFESTDSRASEGS
jgi:hypothetical protein